MLKTDDLHQIRALLMRVTLQAPEALAFVTLVQKLEGEIEHRERPPVTHVGAE